MHHINCHTGACFDHGSPTCMPLKLQQLAHPNPNQHEGMGKNTGQTYINVYLVKVFNRAHAGIVPPPD